MSLKNFKVISKLGEGAYTTVYRVKRNSDEKIYALKKAKLMNLNPKEQNNALNEVRILASIRNPNIISQKEAFLDKKSNSLCIIMEYADNGDLFQKISAQKRQKRLFDERYIWDVFLQVVKGLRVLHERKIFHRDLKSANVFLFKNGTTKLGDLNVSKIAKKGLLYTQTGTPYYASPEVWKDKPYDQKSDIWSLGCVLYEMTTLRPPFHAKDMKKLYKKVISGIYPPIPTHYSQDLNNIIKQLLKVHPKSRPTCKNILQFPFCQNWLNDKTLIEPIERNPELMKTIQLPRNLHYLTDKLPKPNYKPLQTRKIDKTSYIRSLMNASKQFSNSPKLTRQQDLLKKILFPAIPMSRNKHSQKQRRFLPLKQTKRKNQHKQRQLSKPPGKKDHLNKNKKNYFQQQKTIFKDPVDIMKIFGKKGTRHGNYQQRKLAPVKKQQRSIDLINVYTSGKSQDRKQKPKQIKISYEYSSRKTSLPQINYSKTCKRQNEKEIKLHYLIKTKTLKKIHHKKK